MCVCIVDCIRLSVISMNVPTEEGGDCNAFCYNLEPLYDMMILTNKKPCLKEIKSRIKMTKFQLCNQNE